MRYGFRANFQNEGDRNIKSIVEWSGFTHAEHASENLNLLLQKFEQLGGPDYPDHPRMKVIHSLLFSQEIDE